MASKRQRMHDAVSSGTDSLQQKREKKQAISMLLDHALNMLERVEDHDVTQIEQFLRESKEMVTRIRATKFDVLEDHEKRTVMQLQADVDNDDQMLNEGYELISAALNDINLVSELLSDLQSNAFDGLKSAIDETEDALEELLEDCGCELHVDTSEEAAPSDLDEAYEDYAGDDEVEAIAAAAKASTSLVSAEYQMHDIKYAPVMPVKHTNYTVNCGAIQYTDERKYSAAQLKSMGNAIKAGYADLSDARVNMYVRTAVYNTGTKRTKAEEAKATKKLKGMFPPPEEGTRELFLTVKPGSKVNHAGGNSAQLTSTLITTGKHETGHILKGNDIPTLKHANRYAWVMEGKGRKKHPVREFQPSRDGSSFMSIYSARWITAMQVYSQGWYYEKQVAMYNIGDSATTYNIQLTPAKQQDNRVNAVLIPQGESQAPLMLSLYQYNLPGKKNEGKKATTMGLYTGANGGSTRLDIIGNGFEPSKDIPVDIAVDIISRQEDYWTVRVRPPVV